MADDITEIADTYGTSANAIESVIPDLAIRGSNLSSECEEKNVPLEAVFWIMIRRGWHAGRTRDGEDIYLPPGPSTE